MRDAVICRLPPRLDFSLFSPCSARTLPGALIDWLLTCEILSLMARRKSLDRASLYRVISTGDDIARLQMFDADRAALRDMCRGVDASDYGTARAAST